MESTPGTPRPGLSARCPPMNPVAGPDFQRPRDAPLQLGKSRQNIAVHQNCGNARSCGRPRTPQVRQDETGDGVSTPSASRDRAACRLGSDHAGVARMVFRGESHGRRPNTSSDVMRARPLTALSGQPPFCKTLLQCASVLFLQRRIAPHQKTHAPALGQCALAFGQPDLPAKWHRGQSCNAGLNSRGCRRRVWQRGIH